MAAETWDEWRIVAKRPGAKRFTAWEWGLRSESVAQARLASARRGSVRGDWDFKVQTRTVTKEMTAWR